MYPPACTHRGNNGANQSGSKGASIFPYDVRPHESRRAPRRTPRRSLPRRGLRRRLPVAAPIPCHALFVREAPRGAPANPGRRRRHSSRRQGGAPDLGYSERRHSGGRRTRPSATSLTDPPRRVRPPLPPPTARGPPSRAPSSISSAVADKGRPRGDGARDGGRSCTSLPPPWHPALRRTHACRRTAAHPRRPPLPRARAVAACAGRCVPTPLPPPAVAEDGDPPPPSCDAGAVPPPDAASAWALCRDIRLDESQSNLDSWSS